jgi:tetratricopeptide (TPR) repeat protein
VTDAGYTVVGLAELEAAGPTWRPIRAPLDVGAFGVNAWVAAGEGDQVIGEHDEEGSGQQELYAVVAGRATFTLDGEEFDAPTGTLVFVRDTAVKRAAVAAEPGTTVIAVGAVPGRAFEPEPWETWASIAPLYMAGQYEQAADAALAALERYPDNPTILYNLACCESLGGRHDDAIRHLSRAAEQENLRKLAETDSDLDPIRERPDFPVR